MIRLCVYFFDKKVNFFKGQFYYSDELTVTWILELVFDYVNYTFYLEWFTCELDNVQTKTYLVNSANKNLLECIRRRLAEYVLEHFEFFEINLLIAICVEHFEGHLIYLIKKVKKKLIYLQSPGAVL